MSNYDPLIDRDDVSQEAWLVQAKGKVPSKSIIRKKLQREAYDHPNLDSDEEDNFFTRVQEAKTYTPDEELLDWALEQSQTIREIIENFISSEDPERILDDVIEQLKDAGVKLNWFRTPQRVSMTYSEIMTKALPASKDELIKLMSRFPIKRPASTVRQFLRRNSASLRINERGEYEQR